MAIIKDSKSGHRLSTAIDIDPIPLDGHMDGLIEGINTNTGDLILASKVNLKYTRQLQALKRGIPG